MTEILMAIVTAIGTWLSGILESLVASYEKSQADHSADKDQANQDMSKVENLPKEATADQESDAGSDALKHV